MQKLRYPTPQGRGWMPQKNRQNKFVVNLPKIYVQARHRHLGGKLELGWFTWKRQDWIYLPFSWLSNILSFHIVFLPLFLPTPLPPGSKCPPPPTRAGWLPSCCPSCAWSWSSTPADAGANVVGSRSPRRVPAPRPRMRSTTSRPCWWEVRPARAWGTPAGRGPTPVAPSASGRRPFWTGKQCCQLHRKESRDELS